MRDVFWPFKLYQLILPDWYRLDNNVLMLMLFFHFTFTLFVGPFVLSLFGDDQALFADLCLYPEFNLSVILNLKSNWTVRKTFVVSVLIFSSLAQWFVQRWWRLFQLVSDFILDGKTLKVKCICQIKGNLYPDENCFTFSLFVGPFSLSLL